METRPPQKSFSLPPFVVHATRGVIRDQRMRRRMMFAVLAIALLLLLAGSTFLQPALDAHQHRERFLIFWLLCGWFTICALLLALFDVLMVRAEARAARRALQEQFARERREELRRHEAE